MMGSTRPDHNSLFNVASPQAGYFTAEQARRCGYSKDLILYHVRSGRFLRARRGLYRLREFPSSPKEEIIAAWLAVGNKRAVVSQESALDMLGLSDVVPGTIHITVPRSQRPRHKAAPGVTIHTTTRPLGRDDVIVREGVRVTAPARSILDAAEVATAPDQILLAVQQALSRGLATRSQLLRAARGRGKRVELLIRRAIDGAGSL